MEDKLFSQSLSENVELINGPAEMKLWGGREEEVVDDPVGALAQPDGNY